MALCDLATYSIPQSIATASRAQLEAYLRDLKTAEANANAALPLYIALLKNERARLERFAQSSGTSAATLRNLLKGLDNRRDHDTAFSSKMFDARAKLYKASADSLSILIEQYGGFKVLPNGQFFFSDRSALARYDATVGPTNAALQRVVALEEERKHLEELQQGGFKAFMGLVRTQ